MYLFGAFLVATGVKLLVQNDAEIHPERNPVFRLFTRLVPAVGGHHGGRSTVVRRGRRHATPLLLVPVCVEATDLVLALDSIPAIFAVTRDPFIVFTSNIFAILGLRSLFFLLAGVMERIHYLKAGLALVLVFVGAKMLVVDVWAIPIGASFAAIGTILGAAVLASWLRGWLLAAEDRSRAPGST